MIKTTARPIKKKLTLDIPENYIGQELEILIYLRSELEPYSRKKKSKLPDIKGLLSREEAELYHKHIQKVRGEWDQDI